MAKKLAKIFESISNFCNNATSFIDQKFVGVFLIGTLIIIILFANIFPWNTMLPTDEVYDGLRSVLNDIVTSKDLMQPIADDLSSYDVYVNGDGTTDITLRSKSTIAHLEATINTETFEVIELETKTSIGWLILLLVLLSLGLSGAISSGIGVLLSVLELLSGFIAKKIRKNQ